MATFLRSHRSVLRMSSFLSLFSFFPFAWGANFIPQGKLIRKSPVISENPTVQMFFDPNRPPVINVTPGRATVVQFPSEVRSCISANAFVQISYADKVSSQNETSSENSWYSAAVFNVKGDQVAKLNLNDVLNMPAISVNCMLRVAGPDSHSESYTWATIGVKIAEPEDTYLVVYLLNDNQSNTGLPTEKELSQTPYVDVEKLSSFQSQDKNLREIKEIDRREPVGKFAKSEKNLEESKEEVKESSTDFIESYEFKTAIDKPKLPKI